MKINNVNSFIRDKNIVIPLYIYKLIPKLDIDISCFIFLMYLNSNGEKQLFDPEKANKETNISISDIMKYIDELSRKNLIAFEVVKNEKNITNEVLSLTPFYEKLTMYIVEDTNNNKENIDPKSICEFIEKEFGRVLSPMEFEIIKGWIESYNSIDLIKKAVKDATYSGINNLRYIDKVLYEWNKKGYLKVEDIEESSNNIHEEKINQNDIFEYDWLSDDE